MRIVGPIQKRRRKRTIFLKQLKNKLRKKEYVSIFSPQFVFGWREGQGGGGYIQKVSGGCIQQVSGGYIR